MKSNLKGFFLTLIHFYLEDAYLAYCKPVQVATQRRTQLLVWVQFSEDGFRYDY